MGNQTTLKATPMSPLFSTIQSLYPEGTVSFSQLSDDAGPGRHFSILFSARRPRLLVPIDTAAASAAMRREIAADSWFKVVGRTIVAAVVASPIRRLVFRDMLTIEPIGTRRIEDHLGDALAMPADRLRFALPQGAPRANGKPVLDLLTVEGARLGFAKISTSPLSARLVRAEVRTLRQLSQAALCHVDVPTVLHAGLWHGHEILIQSALPTGRGRRQDLPVDAMREVARIAGITTVRIERSRWLVELRQQASRLPSPDRERLLALTEAFEARHTAITLDFGSWHGDWGPWNMAWSAGRPQVWDWERFTTGVPVALDAVHFTAHTALRRLGRLDLAAHTLRQRAMPALRRLGLGEFAIRPTIDAYLLEIACRFACDAAEPYGTAIRPFAEWHFTVAEARLGITAVTKAAAP